MVWTPRSAASVTLGLIAGLVNSGPAQSAIRTLLGGSADDEFGCAVAGGQDVDGDDVPDLLIGARRDRRGGPEAGSVLLYSGADGSLIRVFEGSFGEWFGWSVALIPDLNGDGAADVAIGAPSAIQGGRGSGSVFVFSGADGRELYELLGDAAFDRLGISVASAGDVDADGFDDIIASAPFALSGRGYVRVYSGRDGSTLYTFEGDGQGDVFGYSVGGAGDTNADGFADLIVGAANDDDGGLEAGSAQVISGADGGVLFSVFGDSIGDRLGSSVAGAGDVDADGHDDVIVGAHMDDLLGPRAGAAYVYSGATGAVISTLTYTAAEDEFGFRVQSAGDVDADGHADLIVSARSDAFNGTNSGAVHVFRGVDGTLMHTFRGSAGSQLGFAIASAGDVTGNGYCELLAGSPEEGSGGAATLFELGSTGIAPRVWPTGVGCATAGSPRLPRIGYRGIARAGSLLTVTLRGAAPLATGSFFIGAPSNLSLAPIGVPTCVFRVSGNAGAVTIATDAAGQATVELALPIASTLIGRVVHCQWVVADPTTQHAIPIAFSDALGIIAQ